MALTKRTRYEVLRRDNHACRYCGATAPDTPLTVDHVIPVALGGTDAPTNLVTACHDCNAGKSSTNPDAPLVDDVAADALRWAAAITRAADLMAQARTDNAVVHAEFDDLWCRATSEWGVPAERPTDWAETLDVLRRRGLPVAEIVDALRVTVNKPCLPANVSLWRYFVGVCWRKLDDLHDTAMTLVRGDS